MQKLDNSEPTGIAPPSGTTEAEDAKAPETAGAKMVGKADYVPVTKDGATEGKEQEALGAKGTEGNEGLDEVLEGTGQAEPEQPAIQDIPTLASPPPADEVPSAPEVEAAANSSIAKDKSHIVLLGKREEDRTPPNEKADVGSDEASGEPKFVGQTPLREVTATDEAQELPGKKTQEQEAAKGDEAENSIAD